MNKRKTALLTPPPFSSLRILGRRDVVEAVAEGVVGVPAGGGLQVVALQAAAHHLVLPAGGRLRQGAGALAGAELLGRETNRRLNK